MTLGDGEAAVVFLERDLAEGLDALRRETGLAELSRERHGEAASVRRGDEFFGIGARALFETRDERIRRGREHATRGGHNSLSRFERSLPNCVGTALHDTLLVVLTKLFSTLREAARSFRRRPAPGHSCGPGTLRRAAAPCRRRA